MLEQVLAIEVFFLGKPGGLAGGAGLHHQRLALFARDLLLKEIGLEKGRVQPHQEISRFDVRALGNDFEDPHPRTQARVDFALHLDIDGALQSALGKNLVRELFPLGAAD